MNKKAVKIIGIIPSRFSSTRLPGKPLLEINGKSMIQRVYEQVIKAGLDEVIVATDDKRIFNHVQKFGGKVMMTSKSHQNGTERCFEVASKSENKFDVAMNIQGDEPFIHPAQIQQLAGLFNKDEVQIGTLIKKIKSIEELFNPEAIKKVVVNNKMEAIYFSRSPIPFLQGVEKSKWLEQHTYYKHIGIYGFRMGILAEIVNLPISKLELAESLEQLRWLEYGYSIQTAITGYESPSVDTPEDLEFVRNFNR